MHHLKDHYFVLIRMLILSHCFVLCKNYSILHTAYFIQLTCFHGIELKSFLKLNLSSCVFS